LIRLYQITENKKYRDIALKAIAFEQTTYSDEIGNWLDFRFDSFDEQKKASYERMVQWLYGYWL
jgi:lantibiotic modifying enzyme